MDKTNNLELYLEKFEQWNQDNFPVGGSVKPDFVNALACLILKKASIAKPIDDPNISDVDYLIASIKDEVEFFKDLEEKGWIVPKRDSSSDSSSDSNWCVLVVWFLCLWYK